MERHLGRKLKEGEVVHHINEIKHDNSLRNLVVLTRETHTKHHHLGIPKPKRKGWHQKGKWIEHICLKCKDRFSTYLSRKGSYCSRECAKDTYIKSGQRLSPATEFKKAFA